MNLNCVAMLSSTFAPNKIRRASGAGPCNSRPVFSNACALEERGLGCISGELFHKNFDRLVSRLRSNPGLCAGITAGNHVPNPVAEISAGRDFAAGIGIQLNFDHTRNSPGLVESFHTPECPFLWIE